MATVAGAAATGTFGHTGEATKLDGDKLPGTRWDPALLTQAWAGARLKDVGLLRAGLMHSH